MEEGLTPVSLAIDSPGRPVLSKEMMMLYWARKRDLTILVAENEEVHELFETQTYCLYVYLCLC